MAGWLIAMVAAWQAFAPGPFKTHKLGHIRASWPADLPEPKWVADTFANLALTGYDGATLAGDVDLWAADGLDPRRCVPEVVWDSPHQHGVRVDHPPKLAQGARGGWHAIWHFETTVEDAPAVLAATAFVFCPIDAAHEQPPWGATFTSIEMVVAGPNAKAAYCAKLAPPPDRSVHTELSGNAAIDLAFACGVLPRLRGRRLVDDCKGDVLLALDTLGKHAIVHAPPAGEPLDDHELRAFASGSKVCSRLTMTGFDRKAEAAWHAAVTKLGPRLAHAITREPTADP